VRTRSQRSCRLDRRQDGKTAKTAKDYGGGITIDQAPMTYTSTTTYARSWSVAKKMSLLAAELQQLVQYSYGCSGNSAGVLLQLYHGTTMNS